MPATRPIPAGALSALVRACLQVPARCGSTRVVALDGRSGAGKSELARTLAEALVATPAPSGKAARGVEPGREVRPVQVVRLDDVYPGWDGLLPVVPWLRRWLLQPLQAGHPAGYHRYDWTRGTYGEWQPVAAGGVLLLEGVGSGAALLAPYRSLLLWLQAPDDARRERAIARDGPAFAREWDRWAAQEQQYLTRDDPRRHADVIVDITGPTAVLGDPCSVIRDPCSVIRDPRSAIGDR